MSALKPLAYYKLYLQAAREQEEHIVLAVKDLGLESNPGLCNNLIEYWWVAQPVELYLCSYFITLKFET